jgi:protease secretion system membrane fusion protein
MKLVQNNDASTLIREVKTDAGAYARLGWLIVLLGVGGFLLWALVAPLDKGVPLVGTVAKESNRKAVQHLVGGTVQDILVRDGDVVKAGQVLVRMNPVLARSAFDMTQGQYFTARATEARLSAERDGQKKIVFPPELEERRKEPRLAEMMRLQQQLLASRQTSLRNELNAFDENVAGLRLQMSAMQESRDSKNKQAGFLKEQLDSTRNLAREGFVARTRLLELERANAELSGAISEDIGQVGRLQRQVMEMTLRRSQRYEEYQKEVRTMLAEVRREAEALGARLAGQTFELTNAEVRAPAAGTVVGLAVFTQGGVVPAGFRMMDIVPSGDALIVEGQLPVNLVDKVQPGLKIDLMFSAFNVNRTPHIEGEVTQVSADRSVDERSGMPYYVVRAKVTPQGARDIARHRLDIRPGMPVELFVRTGERTMMNYLLKPVRDRMHSSMSED